MRRLFAVLLTALAATLLFSAPAGAKTYSKKLKPQPSREYGESPNFRASVKVKTGRRGSIALTYTRLPVGRFWIDVRKARSNRQPCSPNDTNQVGRGANRRPGKPGGLFTTVASAANPDLARRGKATIRGRTTIGRGVYYVSIRKSKRERRSTLMCNVISGRATR